MKNTLRKPISVVIVLIMLVNIFLACTVQADNSSEPVGAVGLSSDSYYVGSTGGRFISPIEPLTDAIIKAEGYIEISNLTGLEAIKDGLSGKYYLSADINLSGAEWVPLGTFSGTLDGQGFVIRNMKITSNQQYAGLFDNSNGANIRNIGIEGTQIDINFIGNAFMATYAGGICGDASGGVISNCYNAGNIKSSAASPFSNRYSYAGGICGYAFNVTIKSCYNDANSVFSSTQANLAYSYAGGICGNAVSSTIISNCYNAGSIFSSSVSFASVASGSRSYAGGICSNTHDYPIISISNCYNTGSISSSASTTSTSSYVVPVSYVGGICGYAENVIASNCYWYDASAQTVNGNQQVPKRGVGFGTDTTIGRASAVMKDKHSYTGWDFNTIWDINPLENDGYPVLKKFVCV
jgi:hypothetical protein